MLYRAVNIRFTPIGFHGSEVDAVLVVVVFEFKEDEVKISMMYKTSLTNSIVMVKLVLYKVHVPRKIMLELFPLLINLALCTSI